MTDLCKHNTAGLDAYPPRLQKHLLENPICKTAPQYKGYCVKHLPYKVKLQYEWQQTKHADRQNFLDLLHSGKSLGEARVFAGISFEAALEVVNRAIGHEPYLKKEAE